MSSSTPRVLVVDLAAKAKNSALEPDGEARIRAAAPPGWDVRVMQSETRSDGDGGAPPSDEVMRAIVDAEVYFGFGILESLFVQAKQLRWVHSAATGVATALHAPMRASDVLFTNSAAIHAIPIAEYVVAGVLHFLRGLDMVVHDQHRTVWDKEPYDAADAPLREMDTVRALIVGAGGIGSAAATRLTALGATCTGVRRRVSQGIPEGCAAVIGFDEIDAALPQHDVVVLSAPLTPETRGVMSAARLDLLPTNAIVVNVGRGPLLDEDAIADRLARGRLRGAVLDVFLNEPLASSSPLWQLRRALVSPHISPVTPGRFWPRQLDLFVDNWGRYVRGEGLRNLVDKEAGY